MEQYEDDAGHLFRAKDTQSKYAKEMFVAISKYESLLTPRFAEEFKWGYFVNSSEYSPVQKDG